MKGQPAIWHGQGIPDITEPARVHGDPGRHGFMPDLVLDPRGQPKRASAGTNFAASIVPQPLARS